MRLLIYILSGLKVHPDPKRDVVSHDPNLNQSQSSQEPSPVFRREVIGDQVCRQRAQYEVPVYPPDSWVLPQERVLFVERGMADDASGLSVVHYHSYSRYPSEVLLFCSPLTETLARKKEKYDGDDPQSHSWLPGWFPISRLYPLQEVP